MSRSLHRQMARHQTRKERALAHYAALHYGVLVKDFEALVTLCFELQSELAQGGDVDKLAVVRRILEFIKRYETPQKELTTSED